MTTMLGVDAWTFVKTLAGCAEAPVTFQTFDDDAKRKDRSLARVLHGSIIDREVELAALNERGAGVFITVNATDLQGRREENVTGLRALFVDADGVELPTAWPLEPSIVVESRRGRHAYWLLRPGEPLELFGPAQAQLAVALGTDPKVKDLPRVMRLPGTLHRKGEPFKVRLLFAEPENVYAVWEVTRAFPLPRAE